MQTFYRYVDKYNDDTTANIVSTVKSISDV